jgi:hypothetical protein
MDMQLLIESGYKMMIEKYCVSWKKSTMYPQAESISINTEFKICIYDNTPGREGRTLNEDF